MLTPAGLLVWRAEPVLQTMLQSRALLIALILLFSTTVPGKSGKFFCLPETRLSSTGPYWP